MIFSEAEDLSQVQINFSDENVGMMNVCLAIIMFSVAISINVREFREVLRNPRGVLTGLASQLFLFPLLTFFLVLFLRPEMGLALGLILIGACPGGNISNFFSLQSGGNVALSVSLTVVVTLLAPVMTPFNFEFWGSRVTYLEPLFSSITIDYLALAKTVFLIMVAPLIGGMLLAGYRPDITRKISPPLQTLSVLILLAFIAFAFSGNLDIFKKYWHHVFFLVFAHNTLALFAGYLFGYASTRSIQDAKTISIETGIQNGGLGLVIVFTFFGGQGGMALVVAWWGIWDIISGLIIAQLYKRWLVVSSNT